MAKVFSVTCVYHIKADDEEQVREFVDDEFPEFLNSPQILELNEEVAEQHIFEDISEEEDV